MKIVGFLLLISLLGGCSMNEEATTCPACSNPILDSSSVVMVSRVLDGDTFTFMIGSDEIGVRILSIDAFETQHGTHLNDQALQAGISVDSALSLGKQAKVFADSILLHTEVRMYRDPKQPFEDNFGRLLRHIFLTTSSATIAYDSLLLAKGLALTD